MNVILKLAEHETAVALSLKADEIKVLEGILSEAIPVFSTHDGRWHESDRPLLPTLTIVRDEALVPRAPRVDVELHSHAARTKSELPPAPPWAKATSVNPDDLKI